MANQSPANPTIERSADRPYPRALVPGPDSQGYSWLIGCSKGGERGGLLATASPHTSSTKIEAMATHDAVQWINNAYTRGEPPIMTFSLFQMDTLRYVLGEDPISESMATYGKLWQCPLNAGFYHDLV